MSSFVDNNVDSILSLGYLSFTGVVCYGALEVVQAGIGAASLKVSFIAGLILGSMLELSKYSILKDLGSYRSVKNITYVLQNSLILIGIDESLRAFNLLKILNVFEGSMLVHAQSIALFSGILVAQAVGQIANAFN